MRRFQKLSMLFAIVAASSLIFASGCGGCDDDDDNPDARVVDAGIVYDAEIVYDADPPDAEPSPTHSGQLTIVDIALAGDRETTPPYGSYGHGMKHFFTFVPVVDDTATKVFDNRNAIGVGCAAWVYDLATQAPADAVDVGTFSITGTTGNYPAGCVFSGDMYLCPGAGGTAANVTISSAGSAGAFLFTDTTAAFVEADAGQYINIVAANTIDNHPWNGAFPVLARHNATTLVVGNGAKAAQIPAFGGPTPPIEALAAASGYRLLAGAGGPIPASAAGSPEAIADDDAIIIALDAPDDGDFDDFTTTAIDPGDYFTLAPASIVLMNAIPTAGTAFTLGCNAEAASYTGGTAASFVIGSGTDEIDLTHTGGFVGVRAGAEVTIAGATTGLNNGDYVITEVTDDMITYVNADGVAEDFVAATSYVVNDCGDATLTGVSMEFNDGDLTTVLATHTGPTEDAAISDNGDGTMDIEHTGGFSPAYYGEWIALVNTNTPGNAVAFAEIIGATDDAVTVTFDGAIVEEVFAANTTYQVHKKISGLPDRATATKLGTISCAVLGGTSVEVVAGAAAALNTVDPSVIQTTMVRSALGGPPLSDNVNNNNVNILAGHGYVAFTVIE